MSVKYHLKKLFLISIISFVGLGTTVAANAAGREAICDQGVAKAEHAVKVFQEEALSAVNKSNKPSNVKQAYRTIINDSVNNSMKKAENLRHACYARVQPFQSIMDIVVGSFTGGISVIFPHAKEFHVDVSEMLAGYPLGGENAFIPKLRRDFFNLFHIDIEHDNGFLAKLIRDPLRTLFHW